MPLSREFSLGEEINAGIWHITESLEELRLFVSLSEEENRLFQTYTHEQRRKQWLAYRAVIRHLVPEEFSSHLTYDEHGKPALVSAPGFISVSHAGSYASAVYSRKSPVGIDIEELRDRIVRVKERFLSPGELKEIETNHRLDKLYIHWGAKEALYKLYGRSDVDFKNDIYLHPFDYLCDMDGICTATMTTPEYTRDFRIHYKKLGEYMLTVAS
jgi:phosphopantetheinyl transferase